ncbi:MAG: DUF6382 domain-containing protein [Lachnospiraceae bacterium]|nr:DUF6382 domain-containing protein [Lachnospiraceae bacterium]
MTDRKSMYEERTSYQKNGEKSFLVISSVEEPELPYQINMIRYNKIEGLLPVQFFIEDGEYRYFYDISCKESLTEKMRHKKYSIREIRTIMSDLYRCVQQMEEYLLDTNCLILEPEYLFSDKNNLNIQFCFYQDKKESFEKSLEKLFDYFMNQLDYQDEKTVVLVYSLYQKSREEHAALYELMKTFCTTGGSAGMQKTLNPEKRETSGESEWKTGQADTDSENKAGTGRDGTGRIGAGRTGTGRTDIGRDDADEDDRDEKAYLTAELLYRIVPYIPDVVGGYIIARILWYVSKNHIQMSGKTFMLWMFAVAAILGVCGILSVILSSCMEKKRTEAEEENRRKIEKDADAERETERVSNGNVGKQTKKAPNGNGVRQKEKVLNKNIIEQTEKSEDEDGYEEFCFQDFQEEDELEAIFQTGSSRKTAAEIHSLPATVVMCEPELFRAFNPVLVSENKEKFQDILLNERSMVLGKIRGVVDVCLDGKSISRVHAKISQDENGCCITDLGSTNGTFVNGTRIVERQKVYLEEGDQVRIAEAEYRFQSSETQNLHSQRMSDVI